MSDMKILAKTGVKGRVANGVWANLAGSPDGAAEVMDYILALAREGRIFQASVGTVTTPIAFSAYDAQQPELVIDVPSGITIIPIEIAVHLEDSAGTDTEMFAVVGDNTVGAGTSTEITAIYSTRSKRTASTRCKVYSAYSGNGTAPTNTQEFWRWGQAFADANSQPARVPRWLHRYNTPVIVDGAGCVVLYISATSTQASGFIKASWAEFAAGEI